MSDRIHQPYRHRFARSFRCCFRWWQARILGAALSGAGPAVLVIVADEGSLEQASARFGQPLGNWKSWNNLCAALSLAELLAD